MFFKCTILLVYKETQIKPQYDKNFKKLVRLIKPTTSEGMEKDTHTHFSMEGNLVRFIKT